MKKLIFAFAMLLFSIPSLSYASAAPVAGDKIPHNLEALDQKGQQQDFESLKGKKGLVVLFVRSMDWCPYCQKQVVDINENMSAFTEAGYNVVFISYDPVETLKSFTDKHSIGITLLSDPQSDIIKTFGIFNTEQKPGTRFYGIPNPTIYVVNADGTIISVLAKEGYKDRPELKDVLDALRR